MMALFRKPVVNKNIEELRISRPSKSALDKEIYKELKQGWMVKSRTHNSDGLHGVTLVRKIGQPPHDHQMLNTAPSESTEELDALEDVLTKTAPLCSDQHYSRD